MKLKTILTLCFITVVFSVQCIKAQEIISYQTAKTKAEKGLYQEALNDCNQLLERNPKNSDVINLKAWIYSTQEEYSSATKLYNQSLDLDRKNYDALTGLINLYSWQDKLLLALERSNQSLIFYPKDSNFTMLKITILERLKAFDQTNSLIQEYLRSNPSNPTIESIIERLKNKTKTNSIAYRYTVESYKDYYNSTHSKRYEYSHLSSLGPIIIRYTSAKRNKLMGNLFELEAYPKLWKGAYSYINIGLSDNVIFPNKKIGFDLYQTITKSLGFSIGRRHFVFPTQSINLTKFSIEKYIRKYRIEASVFRTPLTHGFSYNYLIHIRHYLKTSDDFIYLIWGKGVNPDIQGRLNPQGDIHKLNTGQSIIGYQSRISNSIGLFAQASLLKNELSFDLNNYVKGSILSMGIRHYF